MFAKLGNAEEAICGVFEDSVACNYPNSIPATSFVLLVVCRHPSRLKTQKLNPQSRLAVCRNGTTNVLIGHILNYILLLITYWRDDSSRILRWRDLPIGGVVRDVQLVKTS